MQKQRAVCPDKRTRKGGKQMLAKKRYSIILEMLDRDGTVHTAELVEALGVSSETVRKDLEELDRQGKLRRIHGGAVPLQQPEAPAPMVGYVALSTRNSLHMEEKQRIARRAAAMVEEGQVVALDYGSTSQVLAQALAARFQRLTVVTNSIQNALILADKPGFTVILTGGILSRDERTLVNDFPTGILNYVHVDILFMTVTGIDPVAGLTDQRLGEISMQNQMRNAASRVIVVADSSKFGRASLVRICPISAVEAIVTDGGVDPEQAAAVEACGARLILV